MPTDPKPVDLAAIKEIVSIWKIVGIGMLIPVWAGMIVLWIGHDRHQPELMVISLGIELTTSVVCLVIFGILLFRVSVWHDRHAKPDPKAEPSGDPADISA